MAAEGDNAGINTRIRRAVRGVEPDPSLRAKVRLSIEGRKKKSSWMIWFGGGVIIVIGGLGLFRPSPDPSDAALLAIVETAPMGLRVALGDHVECAILGRLPQMRARSPGQSDALLPAIERSLPEGSVVSSAHECVYRAASVTHVTITDALGGLTSIVITTSAEGGGARRSTQVMANVPVGPFKVSWLRLGPTAAFVVSASGNDESVAVLEGLARELGTPRE